MDPDAETVTISYSALQPFLGSRVPRPASRTASRDMSRPYHVKQRKRGIAAQAIS